MVLGFSLSDDTSGHAGMIAGIALKSRWPNTPVSERIAAPLASLARDSNAKRFVAINVSVITSYSTFSASRHWH